MVNEDFKGAHVTFDENATHQMEIINGLKPKDNILVKSIVGALSKKIIDTIGERSIKDHNDKLINEVGKEWLAEEENLNNPLLHLRE